MIAWDTNFLMRYLITDDDPKQTDIVITSLRREQNRNSPIFISLIVICETTWVLSSAYKIRRHNIIEILEGLLDDSNFEFESNSILHEAIRTQ